MPDADPTSTTMWQFTGLHVCSKIADSLYGEVICCELPAVRGVSSRAEITTRCSSSPHGDSRHAVATSGFVSGSAVHPVRSPSVEITAATQAAEVAAATVVPATEAINTITTTPSSTKTHDIPLVSTSGASKTCQASPASSLPCTATASPTTTQSVITTITNTSAATSNTRAIAATPVAGDATIITVATATSTSTPPSTPIGTSTASAGTADASPARVAIKCISLERAARLKRLQRLAGHDRAIDSPRIEQRVADVLIASGGHRHIARHYTPFHDADTDILHIVTEYCDGGDLYQFLVENAFSISELPSSLLSAVSQSLVELEVMEPTTASSHRLGLSERQSVTFMKQILLGVSFLHRRCSVAHRDLSLENVLLRNGECKISDFGLATDVRRACRERAGKDYYMAPEVVAGVGAYNPVKADVWSLGIMWFMMVTGSPLLPLASPDQAGFAAIAEHGVAPVFESWGLGSSLSRHVIYLIAGMLRVDPRERLSVDAVLRHPLMRRHK